MEGIYLFHIDSVNVKANNSLFLHDFMRFIIVMSSSFELQYSLSRIPIMVNGNLVHNNKRDY